MYPNRASDGIFAVTYNTENVIDLYHRYSPDSTLLRCSPRQYSMCTKIILLKCPCGTIP